MASDFRGVDEAFRRDLAAGYTPAEIAELAMMIGQYIALGRLLVVTGGHQLACEIYVPDAAEAGDE
jgi:hypothetical protein